MTRTRMRMSIVALTVLIIVTGAFLLSARASRIRRAIQDPVSKGGAQQPGLSPSQSLQKAQQALEQHIARFPVVDYDKPDTANPIEKAKRATRNRHYDGKALVTSNPYPSTSSIIEDSEVFFNLPALPVAESDVILTAQVLNSSAHLSNDKSAVYSEFCAQIGVVIKGVIPESSKGDAFTVFRMGGVVVYPSGQKVRYEVARQNMPSVGKTYLFFLRATQDASAFEILTGYEIGPAHVLPLDDGIQFEAYNRTDSVVFLNTVRSAVSNEK